MLPLVCGAWGVSGCGPTAEPVPHRAGRLLSLGQQHTFQVQGMCTDVRGLLGSFLAIEKLEGCLEEITAITMTSLASFYPAG